ncbi:MAG: PrsW family intramembrane metalloprotease [Candidatus Pacebacteria bacterium]|nr:PrsW family intramembrane metalloprotease [Candidatus Paceibacterota bacterium]
MGLTSIISLLILGLVPSFSWLAFYVHEDPKHPEPKKILFLSFLAGAISTFAVLPIQIFSIDTFTKYGIEKYSFPSFLFLAGIEEIFKFLAVYLLIHKRKEFDEPLHAMIYMIASGLGFAATENIASIFQIAGGDPVNIAVIQTLVLRFMGATLLHSLTSGLIGYYWGLSFFKTDNGFILNHHREGFSVFKGVMIATLLHAIFNYLIITTGPATLAILFVVIVSFFLLSDFEKFKLADT